MKFAPYYKKNITSSQTSDLVLARLNGLLIDQRASNFPDNPGFVGGDVMNHSFKLYTTVSSNWIRIFSVTAFGQLSNERDWTVKFTCNWTYSLIQFGLLIYASTEFPWIGIPLIVGSYTLGLYHFNNESRKLESLITEELQSI